MKLSNREVEDLARAHHRVVCLSHREETGATDERITKWWEHVGVEQTEWMRLAAELVEES